MSGIFTQFLQTKIDTYQEPTRQGTSKGDPIGFSKQKFQCAVLSLSSDLQKDIAKACGVSHGMLRVWRTEAAFLKQTDDLAAEFAAIFWKAWVKYFDARGLTALNGTFDSPEGQNLIAPFVDVYQYGTPTLYAIYTNIPRGLSDFMVFAAFMFLRDPKKNTRSVKLNEQFLEIEKRMKDSLHNDAITILQKPDATSEELNLVLFYLQACKPS